MEDARAKAAAEWAKRADQWEAMIKSGAVVAPPPGTKIDPKDIRVEIGPPMTAEEFEKWQARRRGFAKKFSQ